MRCEPAHVLQDVEAASRSGMSPAMQARLVLTPAKLGTLADGLRSLAAAADPLGRVLSSTELAPGLVLTKETVPIGARRTARCAELRLSQEFCWSSSSLGRTCCRRLWAWRSALPMRSCSKVLSAYARERAS